MEQTSSEICTSSESTHENVYFDFESFCTNMTKCTSENVSDSEDIELNFYLLAYEQLYNFFQLLGGAFQFVAQDVKSKIKILRQYWNEEREKCTSNNNFSTVKHMVNYEMQEGLLKNPKYVSGCRTLLRLHRGLDFIKKFLRQLYEVEDDVKLGSIAREIYDETLAPHHSWVIKSTARLAMQFLPTRIGLLNKISSNDAVQLQNILKAFPESLETVNIVYDRVQNIYCINNLLDLP